MTVNHLFKNFLENKQIYQDNIVYWKDILSKIVKDKSENYYWLETQFANSNSLFDGNPMIVLVCQSSKKAIRIIQEKPESNSVEIGAWVDSFQLPEDENIQELVISLELSTESQKLAEQLVKKWMIEDIQESQISQWIDEQFSFNNQFSGICLAESITSNLSLSNIPEDLKVLLLSAYEQKYDELYENHADTILLEGTPLKILQKLQDQDDLLTYKRYLFMALIMAKAVCPTFQVYLPNVNGIELFVKIQQLIDPLLSVTRTIDSKSSIKEMKKFIKYIKKYLDMINKQSDNLFSKKSTGIQAVDEAWDVLKNLLKMTESKQLQPVLLEILRDCFEGYAIFPGSAHRRDLFNWWLLDVVPAVWNLEFPNKLYTINGLQKYPHF